MPSEEEIRKEVEKIEHDVNTYQAKTGRARGHDLEEVPGVDSRVPKYFPGSQLVYGDDLVTNAQWHRHIRVDEEEEPKPYPYRRVPKSERHHRTHEGDDAEAEGEGADNEHDLLPGPERVPVDENPPTARRARDPLYQGRDARQANFGPGGEGHVGGSHHHSFKRAGHEEAEIIDSQGLVAPGSVIEKSKDLQ